MGKSPVILGFLAALAVLVAGCGSSSSSSSGTTGSSAANSARLEHFLLQVGSAAGGSQKTAVSAAAHSFFLALANHDSAKVCNDITSTKRAEVEVQLNSAAGAHSRKTTSKKSCVAAMKTLFLTQKSSTAARQAARGRVSTVRVGGETAYLLFRPRGGQLSYFEMTREKGAWKANSLSPGFPISPVPAKSR